MSAIESYLKSCRELACFCSQNGLIDDQSLHYTVILGTASEAFIEVEFDELLEDSGQPGTRITCRGQLHLFLDNGGRVVRAVVL